MAAVVEGRFATGTWKAAGRIWDESSYARLPLASAGRVTPGVRRAVDRSCLGEEFFSASGRQACDGAVAGRGTRWARFIGGDHMPW